MANVWEKIGKYGIQLRSYSDPLFIEGNKHMSENVSGKKAVFIFDDEEFLHECHKDFICHIPGCVKKFQTLLDFEAHYNSLHRNACDMCHKQFHTQHLLDLHFTEHHDSFFLVQADRQPMYRCFIESCPVKSSSTAERRSHCIEIHGFPSDFRFDESRKQKPVHVEQMDVSETDVQVQRKPNAMPKSFSFGRGVSRGFSRGQRHWHQIHAPAKRQSKADVNLTDMEEALPEIP